MVKAIFFDIDGTLLDTKQFIYQAYHHVLKKHQHSSVDENILQSLMGKSLQHIYSRIAPQGDVELLTSAHREFQKKNLHLSVAFPDAKKTLQTLRKQGFKIGALSNRSKITTITTVQLAGLVPYIDLIYSLEDVSQTKPHPEVIIKALNYFEISPENAVMIGDTDNDILAGKAAGVSTIGALYGIAGESILQTNPDYVIQKIVDVLPLMKKL